MARGWESKSVEEQISQKENPSTNTRQQKLSRAQTDLLQKHDGLVLARAHTLSNLEGASDARYRALLEKTLAHLNSAIANLESGN